MPKIIGVDSIRPTGLKVSLGRNVTFGTKLYDTDTLYNKNQYYFAGMSPGIYPSIFGISAIAPKLTEIIGRGDTYFQIPEAGMPIGLLLTITYPARIVL